MSGSFDGEVFPVPVRMGQSQHHLIKTVEVILVVCVVSMYREVSWPYDCFMITLSYFMPFCMESNKSVLCGIAEEIYINLINVNASNNELSKTFRRWWFLVGMTTSWEGTFRDPGSCWWYFMTSTELWDIYKYCWWKKSWTTWDG